MSLSLASMTGAIAAIADPPQIPVPAEIKFDNFQSSFKAFPTKYPPPKQVSKVKNITERDNLPTSKIVPILKDAPNRTIANFKIVFDVKVKPASKPVDEGAKEFTPIPINKARIDTPTKGIGSARSASVATNAMPMATLIPGNLD